MSHFRYLRQYFGPVKACILDWSGTTADKYVIAPAVVFHDVFKKHGVAVTMEQAREPMGLRKDLHIKQMTEIPDVREKWKVVHGSYPSQNDVDAMFADFTPMQLECLRKYSGLIPGCAEATQKLQKDLNCKIGSTTGFLRSMVDILLEEGVKQGYSPDCTVAGDEVIHGARPKPFMIYRNLDLLDVHPIQSVVKVDDTTSGVEEALEAGCWGVGVSRYSNYMNINTFEEEAALSADEINKRNEYSAKLLRQSGAHYVIDSIADLPQVVMDINQRLARGERP